MLLLFEPRLCHADEHKIFIMPIRILDTLKPQNDADFPVVEDTDMSGGFRVVADTAERDAIPAARKKVGMVVRIGNTNNHYSWDGAAWVAWEPAGSGGGTGDGHFVVVATDPATDIASPVEGMVARVGNTNDYQQYNGSSWEPWEIDCGTI
jgi:hypothetical protein